MSRLIAAFALVVSLLATVNTTTQATTGVADYDAIDRYVQDQVDGSRIPGVSVAIVEGDRILHARGYGNDGRGHDVTADTPFWIGSNTKSFTALATMQLVEAGKIDLDGPVTRYLPRFRTADQDTSARMTVRHLINQTSGFSRQSGIQPLLDEKVESIEAMVANLKDTELNRPVGSTFEYSNVNSVVLGAIIEIVSGEEWGAYIQEHVFKPLGMTDSYTSLDEARGHGLTAVHKYWFGYPIKTDGAFLPSLAPTGSIYASASDMARYLSMYLQGGTYKGQRLLPAAGIQDMLTPETNLTTKALQSHEFSFYYGRGWFVGEFGVAQDARWHLGNLPYFTSWMVLLPETNQAVVVMINAGSQFEIAGANEVMGRIPIGVVNIMRGQEPPTGTGIARVFLIFNAIVFAVVALQLWSLLRLALKPAADVRGARAYVPFLWEIGAASVILLLVPSALGMTWSQAFRSIPDLTLVLLSVSVLWLLTSLVRLYKFGTASFNRPKAAATASWRPGIRLAIRRR